MVQPVCGKSNGAAASLLFSLQTMRLTPRCQGALSKAWQWTISFRSGKWPICLFHCANVRPSGNSKTLDAFDPSKFSVEPNENIEELHFLLNLRRGAHVTCQFSSESRKPFHFHGRAKDEIAHRRLSW